MKKFLPVLLLATVSLMGCATNGTLERQVTALEARARQQDEQIAKLQKDLNEARSDAKGEGSYSEQAWAWINQKKEEVMTSETVVDARERARRCWEELQKKTNTATK